ncbi:MAG: RNA-binding S4 domain-containing protein [Clostridiaceae bacterium]|jgi:ribosome-associated protein|nr:RNA-binding S4 domain-containing protein [Clostridiaceae bacterium]
MEIIKITTPYIKLDQLLKYANICSSGGEAKEIIQNGLVLVNDDVQFQRGKKIVDGDVISFENRRFVIRQDGNIDGNKKITT